MMDKVSFNLVNDCQFFIHFMFIRRMKSSKSFVQSFHPPLLAFLRKTFDMTENVNCVIGRVMINGSDYNEIVEEKYLMAKNFCFCCFMRC